MDPTVIAAIVAGLAGVGLRELLQRLFHGRTKTVIAKSPDGTTEAITVKVEATDQDVLDVFRRNLRLEAEVAEALNLAPGPTQYRRGRVVDFIAQVGGRKVAIEVKNSLERLDLGQLLKYLNAEEGIDKLLVISPDAAKADILHEAVEAHRQVEFIRVSDSGSTPEMMSSILQPHLE